MGKGDHRHLSVAKPPYDALTHAPSLYSTPRALKSVEARTLEIYRRAKGAQSRYQQPAGTRLLNLQMGSWRCGDVVIQESR